MLCPNCGRDNPSDAVFCNACGSKLPPLDDVASAAPGVRKAADAIPEARSPTRHPANPVSSAGGTFVGRQRVMGGLMVALEDALSSQGRVVMLAGEPGIGKTRTSQELTIYAEQKGAQVLWGRCHSEQGAPPYWPWIQVIRSYVRDCDTEDLRSQLGAGAADIAEIVP